MSDCACLDLVLVMWQTIQKNADMCPCAHVRMCAYAHVHTLLYACMNTWDEWCDTHSRWNKGYHEAVGHTTMCKEFASDNSKMNELQDAAKQVKLPAPVPSHFVLHVVRFVEN